MTADARAACEDWWSTSIIEMRPGMIRYRGYAIEDLIGRVSFPADDLADAARRAAERGAGRAPGHRAHGGGRSRAAGASIAIARMAATCGVGINNAMASAINVLGDVHGGAGEQCVEIYQAMPPAWTVGEELAVAVEAELAALAGGASSSCRASAIASTRSTRARRGCSRWSRRQRPKVWSAGASPRSAAPSRGAGPAQGRQAHPDEHRWRHRRDLRRAGLSAAALPRAVRAVALGGVPRPCLGADAASERNKGPIPRRYLWRYAVRAPRLSEVERPSG